MEQALAHLIGDYVLQSDWTATTKTARSSAALIHAYVYGLPFVFVTQSPAALAVIVLSHFVIDRWRLARYVCYLSNMLAPRHAWPDHPISETTTGYDESKPAFMAVWLLIIVDNTMHLAINYSAIRWLG